jgi:hypothetical protein
VLYKKQTVERVLKQLLLLCKLRLEMFLSLFMGEVCTSPKKLIYPLTTSLVFALKDSLNGISTITASTGVPGLSEYSAGK